MHRPATWVACLGAMLMLAPWRTHAATVLRSTGDAPAPITTSEAQSPAPADATLLAVRINEVDQDGDVLAVPISAHGLAVPVEALAGWRLRRPTRLLRIEGREHVALDAIDGLRWRIETSSQTLVIDVPSAAFLRNDFEVVNALRPAQAVAPLGGFINYDLHWQREAYAGSPATQVAGGLLDVGAFSAQGNGRTSAVWRQSGNTNTLTRLDSSWNIDRPQDLSSVRLGDAIGTAGAWGRSVRFGGVQWATNFAVRPGLVSFPMPAVRGEANVPSMVDLYVNNAHQLQGNVPPGAFDLPNVPVVTGAGQIKMVVRDLLGREQVIVQPYYVSPALLKAGLHDYAFEAGTIRQDYGLESAHYGRGVLVATDRVGVTDEFTRELRVEVLRSQQTVGASGIWLVRSQATANLSAAASRGDAGSGWLAAAGVDHQGERWSAGLQAKTTSRGFQQLGQATGQGGTAATYSQAVRLLVTANFATSVAQGGVNINVLRQSTWQGDSYGTVSLSYGRSIGALGYVSVYSSRSTGSASGVSVGVNLIRSLGEEATASASVFHSRDRVVGTGLPDSYRETDQQVLQVQGPAPVGPGFGYQLQAERGNAVRNSGDATWQTENLIMTAGVANAYGANSYRAGASGAFALMPEGVYATRRIDGSFAVVQVGDYEGVRVNRDNQFVGRTDSHGRALVTGLRGYESNRISVEGGDLPLDAQVDDLHVAVAPGTGSGVSVRFPVRRTRAASMRLLTEDGSAVPPGSSVWIDGDAREFPVGLDGKLFLAGLAERSAIRAEWEGHSCRAEVVFVVQEDSVPELGAITCH